GAATDSARRGCHGTERCSGAGGGRTWGRTAFGDRRPARHCPNEPLATAAATAGRLHPDARVAIRRKPALHQEDSLSHSRPDDALLVPRLFAPSKLMADLFGGAKAETHS